MRTILSCFILLFFIINISHAGVIIGGTRVIYNEGIKDATINLNNPDDIPYLVQSWVDTSESKPQEIFSITPPLFKLNGESNNTLRIFLTDNTLSNNKESLFWLNIKATITSNAGYQDESTGKLKLEGTGQATGIAIQLLDKNNSPIRLNFRNSLQNNVPAGDYIFNWKARYIQTATTITPGTANSSAMVNIQYE